jgi:hypothetical protein
MSAQAQQATTLSPQSRTALQTTQKRYNDAHIPYAQVIGEQRSPQDAKRDSEAGKQTLLANAPKLYTEASGVEWRGKAMTNAAGDTKTASAVGYNSQGQPIGVAYLHEKMKPDSYTRVEQSTVSYTSSNYDQSTHAKCKDEQPHLRAQDKGAQRLASPKFTPYPPVEYSAAMPSAPFAQKPIPPHQPHTAESNLHEQHYANAKSPKRN